MGGGLLSLAVFAVHVIVWVIVAKRMLMAEAIPEKYKNSAAQEKTIKPPHEK